MTCNSDNLTTLGLRIEVASSGESLRLTDHLRHLPKSYAGPAFLSQFRNDKFISSVDRGFIAFDGLVLNKDQLIQGEESWESCLKRLFDIHGCGFLKTIKGVFRGVIYCEKEQSVYVFTDPLGSKPMYYRVTSDAVLFSSHAADLYVIDGERRSISSLDIHAAYSLLAFGHMLDDATLHNKVKKVVYGSCIKVDRNLNTSVVRYSELNIRHAPEWDFGEATEELDARFREAVVKQFTKDCEQTSRHLVNLSGGLDSRMTSWVAHQEGFVAQLNNTYSNSGSLDQEIGQEIASDLGHAFLFRSLDSANHLGDLFCCVEACSGLGLFYGVAQVLESCLDLDFSSLGLMHTGMLGDVVVGTYLKDWTSGDPLIDYLPRLSSIRSDDWHEMFGLAASSEDAEHFIFRQRGLNGINIGNTVANLKTETLSPFCYPDFFEYCLSLPLEWRNGHRIYRHWVCSRYPEAANYVWESTRRKLSEQPLFEFGGRAIFASQLSPAIKRRVRRLWSRGQSVRSEFGMHPMNAWYQKMPHLLLQVEASKEIAEETFGDSSQLRKDCISLLDVGSGYEKNACCTLMAAIALWFR